jgi:hypothetical protein
LDTYHVVLYIHLLSLFVGIGAAGALLTCLFQLRSAETLEAAVPWGMAAGRIEKAFPVAILGLFATGAYMTSDLWTWGTGWIAVSLAGLVYVAVNGPLVGGRTGHKLKHALQQNGPGPLKPETRRAARHLGLWFAELTNVGVVLAIVWNMTQKPSAWSSIAALVIAWALGAAGAYWLSRPPVEAPAAAAETS